jgi:pseudouridine-5'-phosphate glycosidase
MTTTTDTTAAPIRSASRRSDAAALDAICAVLNTTDSSQDAYHEIVQIVQDTDRPYVADSPVVESQTTLTSHGLPRTQVQVDGDDAVVLWVDSRGDIHVRITIPAGRPMTIDVDRSSTETEPTAEGR